MGRERAFLISSGATLEWEGFISRKDKEAFRIPTKAIRPLIGIPGNDYLIWECALGCAVISLLRWGLRWGFPRIAIIRTDNVSAFRWFGSSKSHGMVSSPLLKRILQWRIATNVEVIPRYIRSAHNIPADGLTRMSQYVRGQWMYNHGTCPVEIPELWTKWAQEWGGKSGKPTVAHIPSGDADGLFLPKISNGIVEWRSEMFRPARILCEHGSRAEFIEIPNKVVFGQLPDTASEYQGGDIPLLLGSGGRRVEMDEAQSLIRELQPRCAIFTGPGWWATQTSRGVGSTFFGRYGILW